MYVLYLLNKTETVNSVKPKHLLTKKDITLTNIFQNEIVSNRTLISDF